MFTIEDFATQRKTNATLDQTIQLYEELQALDQKYKHIYDQFDVDVEFSIKKALDQLGEELYLFTL